MRELIALVHDEATQSAELSRVLHGLGEDVAEVLLGRHEGHLELKRGTQTVLEYSVYRYMDMGYR